MQMVEILKSQSNTIEIDCRTDFQEILSIVGARESGGEDADGRLSQKSAEYQTLMPLNLNPKHENLNPKSKMVSILKSQPNTELECPLT